MPIDAFIPTVTAASIALFAVGIKAADAQDAGNAAPTPTTGPAGIADLCADSTAPAVLAVRVENVRDAKGQVSLTVYPDDPDRYLEKGGKVKKVSADAEAGQVELCVPLDQSGGYAVVALHDRNGNGKANVWSEGFGFSNNPGLGLSKPTLDDTRFEARPGITPLFLELTYPFRGGS